jgi:hypothetical protein
MEDLEDIVAQLLAAVRKMPPGRKRQDALKEIGLLRNRMCQLPLLTQLMQAALAST